MVQFVVLAEWLSLRSLPPKEAIVAFVVNDMVVVCMWLWWIIEEESESKEVETRKHR